MARDSTWAWALGGPWTWTWALSRRECEHAPLPLDETDEVGGHRQTHIVAAALQFPTDGRAGFDVAATAVHRQRESHLRA